MPTARQLNFSAGELAPVLYARADQVKYQNGLRVCRNCVVRKEGGVTNRPGFQFIVETKDSAKASRLMKFVFNDDQTYILEVGDRYIRFIRNRGQIVVSGVAAWVTATVYAVGDLRSNGGVNYYAITAHTSAAGTEPGVGATWQTAWYALTGTIYEIPTPYAEADLRDLQYVQSGDVITIVHPSYAPHELRRYDHTRWTLTPITFGPVLGRPTSVSAAGGAAGTRHWAVTAVDEASGDESLPGTHTNANGVGTPAAPVTLTWTPPANAGEFYIYRSIDGVSYGFIGKTSGLGTLQSDSSWTDSDETASTTLEDVWVQAGAQLRNPLTLTGGKPQDGKYTIYGRITLSVSGGGSVVGFGRVRAYYQRGAETRVDAGIVANISGTALTGTIGPIAITPISIDVPDNAYATLTIDLVPEVQIGTIISGAPTLSCNFNTASAPDNKIEWTAPQASFQDTGQTAEMGEEPPTHPTIFAAPGEYPSETAFYQQRRLFANTDSAPEQVWGSRIASYQNFSTSTPSQEDDAVSFRLAGEEVNEVRHLVDFGRKLIMFTSGGEWLAGDEETGSIFPPNATEYTSYGAHESLPPLKIGRTVLYVQDRGAVVRDFFKDLAEEYTGGDLTVYAAHLFEGHELVSWDYQQTPHSVVWCVRDDGALLGLTYIRNHGIEGWHRHDTPGLFEDVCVIPEDTEHMVYAIVNRVIEEETKRYIEAMPSRFIDTTDEITQARTMYFVDSGLSYDGWNTNPTTTAWLTSGGGWTPADTINFNLNAALLGATIIGDVLVMTKSGVELRLTVVGLTSPVSVSVQSNKDVPADMQGGANAMTTWAFTQSTFTGLSHLEGEVVSVLGDGFVEASALRSDYDELVVMGGEVTLSQAYAVVHVGLPYLADIVTLDNELSSGPSNKGAHRQNPTKAGVYFEKSRGVFVGRTLPADDDPIDGLVEFKRVASGDINFPDLLTSDYRDLNIRPTQFDHHGRVSFRQVDPLPMTILAVMPQGQLPPPAG